MAAFLIINGGLIEQSDPAVDTLEVSALGVGQAAPSTGILSPNVDINDSSGGQLAFVNLRDGTLAGVSSSNEARLRYNATDDRLELSENAGGYNRLVPFADEATAIANTTTTSTTDVLTNAMTLTPPAGTYMVLFSGSVTNTAGSAQVSTSIYSGGVQVASSERVYQNVIFGADTDAPFCCVAIVTVNGAQAIEGRWRVSGGTGTMFQRSLQIFEVHT